MAGSGSKFKDYQSGAGLNLSYQSEPIRFEETSAPSALKSQKSKPTKKKQPRAIVISDAVTDTPRGTTYQGAAVASAVTVHEQNSNGSDQPVSAGAASAADTKSTDDQHILNGGTKTLFDLIIDNPYVAHVLDNFPLIGANSSLWSSTKLRSLTHESIRDTTPISERVTSSGWLEFSIFNCCRNPDAIALRQAQADSSESKPESKRTGGI